MNFRYVNRTDLAVMVTCILTLVIFSINSRLGSAILLYLNNIIILGGLIYWAIRRDAAGMLQRSLIIGGIGGSFYTFVDKLFAESGTIVYITYLKRGSGVEDGIKDIGIFATPLSVVLLWIYCIAIAIYLYQRLRSVFSRFYIPAVLTGVSAFVAGVVLNNLAARLWVWNFGVSSSPGIGSTPLFVSVALFITFLLSPYILGGQRISRRFRLSDNPIAAGLRCAVILSISIYISFLVFTGYRALGFAG